MITSNKFQNSSGFNYPYFVIFIAIMSASCLNLLDVSSKLQLFWPCWLIGAVFFFNLYAYEKIGLLSSWIIGLLYDVFSGHFLGEYALVLLLISAVVNIIRPRYQFFSLIQKIVIVWSVIFLVQIILVMLNYFFYGFFWGWSVLLSSLTTTILWFLFTSLIPSSAAVNY